MMSFRAKFLGEKIVQISTAEYFDGWSIVPISFVMIEDRWGRRSYRVKTPPGGGLGKRECAYFDRPVRAWIDGGELPPGHLSDRRRAERKPHAPRLSCLLPDNADILSRSDRERLSKVLEMLNSEHDGEIVNAAKVASTFLRARNMTWADALGVEAKE